ncbi:unnamed protein product [marine sediment metagenome]|uniref:Uncharacterized protein n=1 Tax=marine sediment metagenome TaxID=412755 RepID=X0X9C2_9ZZZZ
MRASIAENPQFASKCRAWLDDVEVSNDCFEADEEQGYVLVHKRNEAGRLTPDPVTGRPLWERKEGIVRIEGPKEEAGG